MKTTVTTAERLQLIGLLTLAAKYDAMLTEIRLAVCDLVGREDDEGGHTSDAVYDEGLRDADELLRRLQITVEEPT